jgi:hypothetical protein
MEKHELRPTTVTVWPQRIFNLIEAMGLKMKLRPSKNWGMPVMVAHAYNPSSWEAKAR